MRYIGEGCDRTKESIANDMTFKPNIHAFMHEAVYSMQRFAQHLYSGSTSMDMEYYFVTN